MRHSFALIGQNIDYTVYCEYLSINAESIRDESVRGYLL